MTIRTKTSQLSRRAFGVLTAAIMVFTLFATSIIAAPKAFAASTTIADSFPDAGLASAVADVMGKTVDDSIDDSEFATIATLDASAKDITDLTGLEKLTGLKTLDLSGNTMLDDADMAVVGLLAGLESLNLAGCTNFGDNGMVSIAALTALTTLDLSDCTNVGDNGMESIKALSALTTLDLSGCTSIGNNGMTSVATMTSLESLNLSDCTNVSDNGVAELASLTNLKALLLENCVNVTSIGLSNLTTLEKLEELNISGLQEQFLGLGTLSKLLAALPNLTDFSTDINLTNIQEKLDDTPVTLTADGGINDDIIINNPYEDAPADISDGGVYDSITNTITWGPQTEDKTFTFTVTRSMGALGSVTIPVEVTFTATMFTVTFDDNQGNTETVDVQKDGTITKPADPEAADGYLFDAWYLDEELETPWDFANDTVTEEMTLFAGYVEAVTITATAGDNGTISPSGTIEVAAGSSQTFTFTPADGYEVDTVKVNGTAVTITGNSYTFTDLSEDATIEVSFKQVKATTPNNPSTTTPNTPSTTTPVTGDVATVSGIVLVIAGAAIALIALRKKRA